MSKLIDGDLLAAKAKPAKSYHGNLLVVCVGDIVAAAEVDAVPVVRCRDCRYVHRREDIFMCHGYRQIQADGFCNRGAKMEDGE